MATALTIEALRNLLSADGQDLPHPFEALRSVSLLLGNTRTEHVGREMLLRALARRGHFGHLEPVLDALTRSAGLFPYVDPDALDFRDSIAYEFHRPENMPPDIVFHREQAEIYRRLLAGENLILSAPTSFGKSRVIDALIATGKYKNVAVVVPTLALIDESRRRLATFSESHKIVTHLSQDASSAGNIFIFTPERAVAYDRFPQLDLLIIDEFYKLGAVADDPTRTVTLNQAFYKLRKMSTQFYLLGPNIRRIPQGLEEAFRCTFFSTSFSTVVTEQIRVSSRGKEFERLVSLARSLSEPTLIFCSSPSRVNAVARELMSAVGVDVPANHDASSWASKTYHPDWIFGKALSMGIGIHHGRLPRSLAQYVVRQFNDGNLRFLVCTSTLIEGVNTKAKNVVVFDNSIARRQIDYFTFNNIKGRSGRMFQHFIGRVYLFSDPPEEELPFVDFPVFTQDESAPDSLLIQLEDEDLSGPSRDRMASFTEQSVLPVAILRENASIPPDRQLNLARAIASLAFGSWPQMSWRQFPTYPQLKFACELIWKYLVDSTRRAGVYSGSQLAMKVWQLYNTRSSAARVKNELQPGQYAARSPDEAVERVLQFERTWAGFELPRYLMALSRIQTHVLGRRKLPMGDYSTFASQVESLFRAPVVAALDEYGLPLQIAEKLQPELRTTDDLDLALANLRQLDATRLRLSSFERQLVRDAQDGISAPPRP